MALANKKNMDTKFLRVTAYSQVFPHQGALVSNYIYSFIPLMPTTANTWVLAEPQVKVHQTLYDEMRVNRMTVRYVPKANTLDQAAAQNDAFNVSGNGMYYTAVDRDGPGPYDLAAIQQYPSVRATSILKPCTRKYGVRWSNGEWLDTANPLVDLNILKRVGALGGCTQYAENILEDQLEVINEPWGTVQITWDLVFRGTKPQTTSVTDGVVTITPHTEVSYADAATKSTFRPYTE